MFHRDSDPCRPSFSLTFIAVQISPPSVVLMVNVTFVPDLTARKIRAAMLPKAVS